MKEFKTASTPLKTPEARNTQATSSNCIADFDLQLGENTSRIQNFLAGLRPMQRKALLRERQNMSHDAFIAFLAPVLK